MEAPYINLNGNSEDQIKEDFKAIYKALNHAMDLIARSEYAHGRNSKDPDHLATMKNEKRNVLQSLDMIAQDYFDMRMTVHIQCNPKAAIKNS